MNFCNFYINFINKINNWTGKAISWIILLLLLITVLEVILRRVFNAPTTWSFEVCTQLFGLNFMMAAPFTLLHGGHVSVDIFRSRLPIKSKAILDIICYLIFFFPFTSVMLWKSFEYARMSWAIKETSWSVFAPPLYPIKSIVPLAFLLLILQGLAILISNWQIMQHPQGGTND